MQPIYHRRESFAAAKAIEESQELWGRPRRNIYQSEFPKVKACRGPLPPGTSGIEFVTDEIPDRGCTPSEPTWSAPREGRPPNGVVVENDVAKIKINVIRNTAHPPQ